MMLLTAKTNRTVVRNAAYTAGGFGIRERHNERKNESYHNGDIDASRADMNVHFHRHQLPDGTPETYEQTFNRLMEEGVIVQKGQKKDGTALVFDEMIFDVNTAYFEDNGGYDYAKFFFEEAYRCAVKEIGGEQYVLSAILHADERNKALSEEMGRDVYHHHLHVTYVPIVQKEVLWSKRTKEKSLVGKVKEVIPQISHWKKWPQRVPVERDGKTITLNSYSLLQDRFYEHMRAAGFEGFERGERGSTREHLEVEEYKYQQEKQRVAVASEKAEQAESRLGQLDAEVEKKEKRIGRLDEQIAVKDKAKATLAEVEAMGKPVLIGTGFNVSADELKKLKTLAKKSVTADKRVADAQRKQKAAESALVDKVEELKTVTRSMNIWRQRFEDLEKRVKPFMSAILNFPQELLSFIDRHWHERQQDKSQRREVTR